MDNIKKSCVLKGGGKTAVLRLTGGAAPAYCIFGMSAGELSGAHLMLYSGAERLFEAPARPGENELQDDIAQYISHAELSAPDRAAMTGSFAEWNKYIKKTALPEMTAAMPAAPDVTTGGSLCSPARAPEAVWRSINPTDEPLCTLLPERVAINPFPDAFPGWEWTRITFTNTGRHYLTGQLVENGAEQASAVAVPAAGAAPPPWLRGFTRCECAQTARPIRYFIRTQKHS